MKISVVVPLLDEADSLEELHRRLNEALADWEREILFVDDGSTDGSGDKLREIAESDPNVGVITFRRNRGKSAALDAGFRKATGDIVVTIDADLQDDPAEIPALLNKIEQGCDLVSGWKTNRQDPFTKTIPSKLYNFVTAKFSGIPIHDFNCGLKAYRKEVTDSIRVYGQLHRFIPVLAKMEGFIVGEVGVRHHPRKFGRTKYGPSRFLYGFLDLLTVLFISRYMRRPLHLFGMLGTIALLAGTIINLYLSALWLMGQYIAGRPLFFLAILLMILGVQFFSVGLLGEMITRSASIEGEPGKFLPPRG